MNETNKKAVFEEAPFNMSMLFYIELHELRKLKSRAFIEGNIYGYKDCLEELYTAISFKLTNGEPENIEGLFRQFEEAINSQTEIYKTKSILRKIDLELIKSMHRYKMIFPKVEMKHGMKDLINKYKLNPVK